MKGVEIGHVKRIRRWLAINPGNAVGSLDGDITQEPAFGFTRSLDWWQLREQHSSSYRCGCKYRCTFNAHALQYASKYLFDRSKMLFDRVVKSSLNDRKYDPRYAFLVLAKYCKPAIW